MAMTFLDLTPKAKRNKWHYIKLKSFSTAKKITNKIKRHPTKWKEILINDVSDRGEYQKYIKNSHNSRAKNKQTNKKCNLY